MTAAAEPTSNPPITGEVVAENFDGWSDEVRHDFEVNAYNYEVGTELLSETDTVKVWLLRVGPGERVHAHRHVLDYFWTAMADGVGEQHEHTGVTRRTHYTAGTTRHLTFPGESYLLHDLVNVGDTEMVFLTVEHKP